MTARVIAGTTMSLDGFVADPSGSVSRLYPDFDEVRNDTTMEETIRSTGAVLMGRRTFEMGDPDSYVDTYEFHVPIFVVTHRPPAIAPKQDDQLTFTFVCGGIKSAVAQAQKAAGERDVQVVGGVNVIRQLLTEDLVDELHVDVMPVLLSSGLRLFDGGTPSVDLEKIDVREIGARTAFRFSLRGS